jgi:hypothetical protein
MQTVEAMVKINQQSKSKKMVTKGMAAVWQQPPVDDGNATMATVTETWRQQWQRQRRWLRLWLRLRLGLRMQLWLRWHWRPRQWQREMAEMRSTALLIMVVTVEARTTAASMAAVMAAALATTAMRAMAEATAEA